MNRQVARYLGVPLTLLVAGIAWMALATYLFQRETGRPFYGLAGNHYSVPDWGFAYLPGGEGIERWAVTVPGNATIAALLISAVVATVAFRQSGWQAVAILLAVHLCAGLGMVLVTTWYWFNVMGVFI